jgi:hypothetical protein
MQVSAILNEINGLSMEEQRFIAKEITRSLDQERNN